MTTRRSIVKPLKRPLHRGEKSAAVVGARPSTFKSRGASAEIEQVRLVTNRC